MRRILAGVVAAGVLLSVLTAEARPKVRPPQSQPARATAKDKAYRPPDIVVKGKRQAPIKLVFGRQAPTAELRSIERDRTLRLFEAVRRGPF